jgi:hypothetical protein
LQDDDENCISENSPTPGDEQNEQACRADAILEGGNHGNVGTSSTEISMHTTIGSWPNFEEDRSGAAVTKRIETVVRALEYTYKGNVLVISSLNHLGIQVVR